MTIDPGTNQSFESYEDWKQMESSEKYIDAFVGAMTATEDKKLSILMGMGYDDDDFTEDPEEAANDPSKILMRESSDGSSQMEVVLSDAQKKAINDRAEGILKSQLDEKESFTKGFQSRPKSPTEVGVSDRDRQAGGLYEQVVNLVTGDGTLSSQAATSLASIINDKLPEDDSPLTNITRTDDGNTFVITREDGSEFKVDRKLPNGEMKTNKMIIDEMFQEVNPYENVDLQLAEDAYSGEIGGEVGTGEAQANVQTKAYDVVDMASTIQNLDNKTPADYVEQRVGDGFQLNFLGAGETDDVITDTYTTVLNNIVPQNLFEDIGGTSGLLFDYDGTNATVTVGGTQLPINNLRDKSPQEVLKEVERAINQERERRLKGSNDRSGGAEGDDIFGT